LRGCGVDATASPASISNAMTSNFSIFFNVSELEKNIIARPKKRSRASMLIAPFAFASCILASPLSHYLGYRNLQKHLQHALAANRAVPADVQVFDCALARVSALLIGGEVGA